MTEGTEGTLHLHLDMAAVEEFQVVVTNQAKKVTNTRHTGLRYHMDVVSACLYVYIFQLPTFNLSVSETAGSD